MRFKTTLSTSVTVSGIGVHTGKAVTVRLLPALPGSGLRFRRVDLNNHEIPVNPAFLQTYNRATILVSPLGRILTPEHLLSALVGLGIDDCVIEIDSEEPPILDGSAKEWVAAIQRAGISVLDQPKDPFYLTETLSVSDENGATITGSPAETFSISYTLDYPHPLVGLQTAHFDSSCSYETDIAPCRTFGLFREYEALVKQGLAKGSSIENTLVFYENHVEPALRFDNEPARHKVLDLMGDLATFGRPIIGHFDAYKSGHALNAKFVQTLNTKMAAL